MKPAFQYCLCLCSGWSWLYRCWTRLSEEQRYHSTERQTHWRWQFTAKQTIRPSTCQKSSTTSQALAKIPHSASLVCSKPDGCRRWVPRTTVVAANTHSLLSSASKLCGHCGLALQCVFVSCGHHVVSFSTEPAILYSSRTVAQCAPASLCKGSRS